MLAGNLYIFFGEMSIYVFHPFLDGVVCFFDIELHELLVYVAHIYNGILLSHKRNEIESFVETWMHL